MPSVNILMFARLRGDRLRARRHDRERERARGSPRIVGTHQRARELAAIDPPAQEKVAIEPLAGQDLDDLRIALSHRDCVQARRDVAHHAIFEDDPQAEPHRVRAAG
jgi:hypothetical protein